MLSIWKGRLIKDDMTRDDQTVGREVKAAVSFVMSRITQEDTEGGARREFVGSCGRQVGVTFASKDAQVIIHQRCAIEGAVWRGELEGLGWQNVNQNGHRRESLGPVGRRHGGLKQQGANYIIEGANNRSALPF